MKRFFDERARKSVIAMLSLGMTRRDAAHCVGCTVGTLYNEAARDAEFHAALVEAESGFEVRHRKRIDDASKSPAGWRASAWAIVQKQKSLASHTVTRQHIDQLLVAFAEILAAEVPDRQTRKRMLDRLCRALGVKRKSLPSPTKTNEEPNDASPNQS